jgi:hypothetical protein
MVWTIRVVKGNTRYAHVADELHAALAVACIFLRSGIAVEEIDGPDGVRVSPETIQEFCGGDADASAWRRARFKFLSR